MSKKDEGLTVSPNDSKPLVMLPCPFCGGEPEIKQEGRNGLKLKCKSCLMGIKQKTLRYSLDWLREKMIEGWNRRV